MRIKLKILCEDRSQVKLSNTRHCRRKKVTCVTEWGPLMASCLCILYGERKEKSITVNVFVTSFKGLWENRIEWNS
jgi:hypothetical protein